MFGLEIIDVMLGLSFVYLLLSLICSAVNEYIAGITNRRGRALVVAIEKLLHDVNDPALKYDVLEHRLIRSMHSRDWRGRVRAPSYIPARTFAMALLDTLENRTDSDAARPSGGAAGSATARSVQAPGPPRDSVRELLNLMKDDSLEDVMQAIPSEVEEAAEKLPLSAGSRRAVSNAMTSTRTELQKLHDSVEVWFNNAMDRVSGGYKRRTQLYLWLIGLVVAVALNADTIQMWQRLSTDDELRDGVAAQAAAALPALARLQSVTGTAPAEPTADDATATPAAADDTSATDTSVANDPAADTALATDPDTGFATDSLDTGEAETTTPDEAAAGIQTDLAGNPQRVPRDSASLATDTLFGDLAQAKAVYDSATMLLDRTQLSFGWSWEDAETMGMARRLLPLEARARRERTIRSVSSARIATLNDIRGKEKAPVLTAAEARQVRNEVAQATPLPVFARAPVSAWRWWQILAKLAGLVLTACALSLGAPFWFDTLNKIINVRGAGRAPDERPKSPEAPGKRMAEQAKR